MQNVTAEIALNALKKVVEDRGSDYRYLSPIYEQYTPEGCRYAYEGCPSCGVGQALFDLGMPIETLESLDQLNAGNSISARLLYRDFDEISMEASRVFCEFQTMQDQGISYGVCFIAAQTVFDSLK